MMSLLAWKAKYFCGRIMRTKMHVNPFRFKELRALSIGHQQYLDIVGQFQVYRKSYKCV